MHRTNFGVKKKTKVYKKNHKMVCSRKPSHKVRIGVNLKTKKKKNTGTFKRHLKKYKMKKKKKRKKGDKRKKKERTKKNKRTPNKNKKQLWNLKKIYRNCPL